MKRTMAMLVLLVFAWPTQAHFIWLVPQKDGQVQMVFSDSLDPDGNVAITKIAQTTVVVRGKGDVKKTEAKDHYLITTDVKPPLEIAATCKYGALAKKGDPYLLMYYAKTSIGAAKTAPAKGDAALPLEIVSSKPGAYQALWQGKLITDVEMTALVPGEDEARELKRTDDGVFLLGAVPKLGTGFIGLRAKFVEKKAGEIDGKAFKEVRHYSTWTFAAPAGKASGVSVAQPDAKADPAASKLLADARAARAVWTNFPGFSADLDVNVNGKIAKGKVDVEAAGKVTLKLDADDTLKASVRREISSLVSHRLPGTALDTPCAFIGNDVQHPSGVAIRVLNDELHSSYRIRDRQIIEVNRAMKDIRFTITVLENTWNKEKQYLPTSYVVSSWDIKTNALISSSAHHDTWTRIGAFDLPETVRVVNAKAGQLENRLLTFSNVQLGK